MKVALEIAPGLASDDTTLASAGRWADGSNVRFRLGRPQAIGGWEAISTTALTGVCRTAFPWTDNDAVLNLAFGTHSKLQLFQGGAIYDLTPASGFTAGAIDGAGSAGFGTGAWGIGAWSEPSVTDYFPLTWSLAAWGEHLLANPRGQSIFGWTNNTANKAVALTNAPANVTHMLVATTRQVFALGCNEEVSGTFNPLCIRHSDVASNTGWSTTASSASTSREYILPGGGRIVAGRVIGRYILVWTTNGLFLGTYVGQIGQVWRFDRVGDKCGLIGPNAAIVVGSTAYWISPDRQFHAYSLGGAVSPLACEIREDFADNLAASQGDKITASSLAEFNEVRFDYPDARDGYENSRYLVLCVEGPDAGAWHRGQMARTAMVDAGPSAYPCGVTYEGLTYWHERGASADGSALSWFIESADLYLDEESTMMVRGAWPDIKGQVGAASLTLTVRYKPQGATRTYGPYIMTPDQERVDIRAKGRLFRVKISGSASPSYARIGRPVFDAVATGGR